jgi:hypothetical protein
MNSVLLALLLLVQGIAGPTGTVEGRVLNQDGTPAANARVSVLAVQETTAAATEAPVLSSIVQTDANGRYRLENVTPGRYYIGAGLVDFPTYYPGVIAISEARVVTVAARSALTGIDFNLARPAALKVSGRVIREARGAAEGQRVLMSGPGGSRNFTTPADGSFEFVGLFSRQVHDRCLSDKRQPASANRCQRQRRSGRIADSAHRHSHRHPCRCR